MTRRRPSGFNPSDHWRAKVSRGAVLARQLDDDAQRRGLPRRWTTPRTQPLDSRSGPA